MVFLCGNKLLEMQRTQTPREFNKPRGEADELLGSLYFSLESGLGLAKQMNDLIDRSLNNLSAVEIKTTPLKWVKQIENITL